VCSPWILRSSLFACLCVSETLLLRNAMRTNTTPNCCLSVIRINGIYKRLRAMRGGRAAGMTERRHRRLRPRCAMHDAAIWRACVFIMRNTAERLHHVRRSRVPRSPRGRTMLRVEKRERARRYVDDGGNVESSHGSRFLRPGPPT